MDKRVPEVEVMPVARDILSKEAPEPDLFPAETFKKCPAVHETLAGLFPGTLERGPVRKELRRFFVAPPDKKGEFLDGAAVSGLSPSRAH